MAGANDYQIGGDHYKQQNYQHWDFVADTHQNYFQGQATRYISRARLHVDGPRMNYEKALHYIDKAQELRLSPPYAFYIGTFERFVDENTLTDYEQRAIYNILLHRWDEARAAVGGAITAINVPGDYKIL